MIETFDLIVLATRLPLLLVTQAHRWSTVREPTENHPRGAKSKVHRKGLVVLVSTYIGSVNSDYVSNPHKRG